MNIDSVDQTEMEVDDLVQSVEKHKENRRKICLFCFKLSEKTIYDRPALVEQIRKSLNLFQIF